LITALFSLLVDHEYMVEILWNSQAPHLPTRDQEFYELRLVDLGTSVTPRYVVREIRGSWSASAQQIRWNGFTDQTCRTPEEAKRRFESRRASIVDAGFPYATLVA
jgi:hypothetical protein